MNAIEDKWSMDESEILPIMDESILSFVEHRVLKATGIDDSGHDREDSYTSISSSTSCTDAMADSQLELANARLMQANALADIARLKVAKAAKQAVSASSGRSSSRLEGIKPITFDVEPNPRDRGSLNAVISDMQTDNLEITGGEILLNVIFLWSWMQIFHLMDQKSLQRYQTCSSLPRKVRAVQIRIKFRISLFHLLV